MSSFRQRITPTLLALAFGLVSVVVACGQAPGGSDLGALDPASASRFAGGLLPLVQVEGESYQPWSLEERMAHYHVPGLSLAVFRDGEVVWARGYGSTSSGSGQEVAAETQFAAGPFSMSLTALAAARLSDQGAVALDAELNDLLSSWRLPSSEHQAPVTLRQLLNHIAGAKPAELTRIPGIGPLPSRVEVLEGVGGSLHAPLTWAYRPGLRFSYSEAGFALAELALMDITGSDFSVLMERLVQSPLSLGHSEFSLRAPASGAPALPHDARGEPIEDYGRAASLAADGLWTTASDFARVMIALQGSLDRSRQGFLRSVTGAQVLRRGLSNRGLGFEVWDKGGPERFGVSGPTVGGYALAWSLRHRAEGAVILVNGARGEMLCREVLLAVAHERGWGGVAPTMSEGVGMSTLLPLVGTYRFVAPQVASGAAPFAGALVQISLADGGLVLAAGRGIFPGEDRVVTDLYPAEGQYVMTDRPQRLGFEWEGETLAAALILDGVRAERVAASGSPISESASPGR